MQPGKDVGEVLKAKGDGRLDRLPICALDTSRDDQAFDADELEGSAKMQ